MSLENKKTAIEETTVDPKLKTQKSCWCNCGTVPSLEKEVFRTIVVNRRRAKMSSSKKPSSSQPPTTGGANGSHTHRRRTWSHMLAAMSIKKTNTANEAEEDFVPDLRSLYADSSEDISKAAGTSKIEDAIKIEVYSVPPEIKATVDESTTVIMISDDDENNETERDDTTPQSMDTAIGQTNANNEKATQKDAHSHNGPLQRLEHDYKDNVVKLGNSPKPLGLHRSPSTCSSHKLKVNTQPQNTFKQRQLELHRYRITVEQRRLELLDIKLARERDEMLREQILFEKELELKASQLIRLNEDKDM